MRWGPYRRAIAFVLIFGFLVQITGINAIVSYSPFLFGTIGLRSTFAQLVLPALVQVCALAAVLVSLVLVDRVGRRVVLLSGIGLMIMANLLLIGCFALGAAAGGVAASAGIVGVLLFAVGFNVGFGPLACVYAGESLPARLRSIGSAVMQTSNLVANALVVGVFLTVLTSLGGVVVFAVFGVLAQVGFVFVYRFAPETKARRLEDIRHLWVNAKTRQLVDFR